MDAQDMATMMGQNIGWMRFWSAAFVVTVWDWLITLDAEMERIWKCKKISVLALWFFVRYWPILQILVSGIYFFSSFPVNTCHEFAPFPAWALLIEMTGQHIVFITRTYALYRRDKRVLAGLIVLLLLEIGLYLRALTRQIFIGDLPLLKALHQCVPSLLRPSDGLSLWGTSFAIDIAVFLLTLVRTIYLHRRAEQTTRSILAILLRDGVGYFGIITFCNVFNLILFTTKVAGNVNPLQFGVVASAILTPRLILNLRGVGLESEHDGAATENLNTIQATTQIETNFVTLTAVGCDAALDCDEDAAPDDRWRSRARGDDIEYLSG